MWELAQEEFFSFPDGEAWGCEGWNSCSHFAATLGESGIAKGFSECGRTLQKAEPRDKEKLGPWQYHAEA